jgi:ABC-type glycerol-3-phosphate transport system permease component
MTLTPLEQFTEQDAREMRHLRRLRGLVRVLVIYGLLLGGAVVFSMPFAWMIGTSFKVDRELFGEQITLVPMAPVPAARSPYLDPRYFPVPRGPATPAARPAIEQALAAAGAPVPEEVFGREDAVAVLTPGLFQRLRQTLPEAVWQGTPEAIAREVRGRVDAEMVTETLRKVHRRLSFGPVRVRSFDLQEEDVVGAGGASSFWTVEGDAPARLVNQREGKTEFGDLVYDFAGGEEAEVRLSRTVELPFRADRLHRIQLSVRPDDSWHALAFEVEKGGRLYRGQRPEYLGNFQWSVITLQDYGPDDQSTKIRLWIPLVAVDEGPRYENAPDRVKLTLTLKRNSALGAWWAKCQRNYRGSLDYIPFWRYTATSALLVILNIVGTLFSCSLVAFSFARLQWPGRNISFALMMATMMIPPQVTMIPYFLIIKHLGWYNTLKPLWVVSFFGNAFNIFLLRQFMKGIPRDLEDAARIDGCNSFQVYRHVIMPLIQPTLACIAIFTFMGVWNDFMGPLIYLSDQRLYPLSLGLYAFNVQAGGSFGMMMAGSMLMTLPVVVVFFFAQKYFIQGVTLTGMKA